MKKLMAMIGAVAMAFGLYADGYGTLTYSPAGLADGTKTIVGYTDDATTPYTEAGSVINWWSTNCQQADFEQPATVVVPEAGEKYLQIETEGTPMLRTFNAVAAGELPAQAIEQHGLFVDMKVQLTGFEPDSEVKAGDGNKLLVWLKAGEGDEGEGIEGVTNLMVTCGYWDKGDVTATNYVLVAKDGSALDVKPGDWVQFTVRANQGTENVPTFNIYVNQQQVKAIVDNKDLLAFPSLIGGASELVLKAAGFEGNGAIENVNLYGQADAPAWAADPTIMNIVWDANVESIAIGGDNIIDGETSPLAYTVPFGEEITATIAYKQGYRKSSVTGPGLIDFEETDDGATFKVAQYATVADAQLIVASERDRDEASLVIDGEVIGTFSSLAGVFAKIKELYPEMPKKIPVATITLNEDATADDFGFNDEIYPDITIDLNGKTIVCTNGDPDFVAFGAYGILEIIDTSESGGGKIIGNIYADYELDVREAAQDIVIDGNIDYNVKENIEAYLTIERGKFNDPMPAGEFVHLGKEGEDMEWDGPDKDGFYVLRAAEPPVPGETFTVTVPPLTEGLTITSIVTNNVPVANPVSGDYTLNEGELFTMTYAPDEGYKFTNDSETGVRAAEEETTIEPPAVEEMAEAVAKIDDVEYTTLQAAFTAAQKGNTITMLKDVVLSERIFVMNEEVTLDLAGKKIEWDTSVANKSGVLIVCRDAQLTIDDSSEPSTGVIDAKGKAYAAVALTHGDDPKNSQTDLTAKLIVNGGTLIGNYQGIVGNGTRPNTYIEINGGVITASNEETNQAIFNPQTNSVVVINDGTITGLDSAIEMRGGTLTVNGGTLTSTAEMYAVKPNGSGSTVVGAAVAVSQHTTKGDLAVEIKGGTLTGLNAVAVANPQGNDSENVGVVLGDATYNGALAFSADGNATVTNDGATIVPPADYKWDENGNLVKKVYVAQIGANKYETFDAAWAAAQGNDEITLLADCTFGTATSAQVKLNKNLKLTLNGKVLTVKNKKYDRIYVVDNKTLTVDGTAEGSKLIGTLYAGIRLSAGHYSEGNIAINGGTYVASDHNEYGLAAIQSNGGCENSSITATDATFIGGNMSVEPTDDNRDQQGIAAVLAAGGTYTFTDCEFTGRTGIYAKAGTLTLDDCTVAANGTQFAPVANTDGSDPTGDAIIFDSNSSYNGDLTLVVTGDSSISSENGYAFQETVTKGSASATLAVSIADTVDVDGEVVLSDAFAAAVKAGTAAITGYVATVNNIAYQTVAEALLAVQALEAEEEYPITVAALAADGLTITDGDNTAKIAAGVTITITKGAWAVNDTLNYAGEIDGAVTAVAIAKIEDAAITLNKDASVTITGDVVPETSFFTCGAGEGYEVKKNGNVFTVGLIQVTATFVADGKTVDTQVIDYGTAPAKPADPVKEGYTFTGWDPEISAITEDTDYVAQFDEDPYDLTVTTPENGTLTTDPAAGKIEAGTTVTVTATPNTGYALKEVTFNGVPVDKWDSFTMLHEPVTVAATFTAEVYTITYTFTGVEAGDVGKVVNTNPKTYTIESETITFADASCEGYTFKGWDIAKIDAGSTGNKTITGTFEKAEDPLPIWVPAGEKEAYNTWKQGPGKTESDFTGDVDKKMEDSFLLDCEPTEAALQSAKANFKITSITKDTSGNWVVLTVDKAAGQSYGNGLIKLEAFESVGCTGTPVTPGTQPQLFWKASLVHPTAN